MNPIRNLEGMIEHAIQHPHLQTALTEKLLAHYESTLESIDASTITTNDFNDLLITPISTLKDSMQSKGNHLENTLSKLAPYAPSIVYFFEKASRLNGVDVSEYSWTNMSCHAEMCSAMLKVLDALDETNVEDMKRVISSHFNQYTKFDSTSYGCRDLLISFDDLMHDIHVYTNLPKELEHHLIAELFKAINRVDVDVFSAHTPIDQHLHFYAIASNLTVTPDITPYSNADETLNFLKASIDFSGNDIDDDENFTHSLCNVFKNASTEAVDSFIDYLIATTWNADNFKVHDDVKLLAVLLSYPNTTFSLSEEQSERILSNIEHVMSTSQTYGYKDVSQDATTDDLVRVFKSRIKFLNTFITQGSDPKMNQRVLELMNREHAIAFRDGLLDVVFESSADAQAVIEKNVNIGGGFGGGFLEDLEITLEIIQKANGASDTHHDPLAQSSNDKLQSLQ